MRSLPAPAAAALDLLCILVFVGIGRANHDEGNALLGFASTAWPFTAALAIGWAAARAWRSPTAVLPTGALVWAVTVAGGMLLRTLTGESAETSFILVTSVFLGATMLGWRSITRLVTTRRTESTASSAAR